MGDRLGTPGAVGIPFLFIKFFLDFGKKYTLRVFFIFQKNVFKILISDIKGVFGFL